MTPMPVISPTGLKLRPAKPAFLAPKARTALESLGVTVANPTTTEEDSSGDEGIQLKKIYKKEAI